MLAPRQLAWLVAAAGAVALGTAFTLQFGFREAPCHLCVLERWPWVIVVLTGALAAALGRPRAGLAVASLALLAGAGLSGYHVAVEQGWLALPGGCVAGGEARDIEELRALLFTAQPTCDQVSVRFMGVSLAAWNGLASLATLAVAALGMREAGAQQA